MSEGIDSFVVGCKTETVLCREPASGRRSCPSNPRSVAVFRNFDRSVGGLICKAIDIDYHYREQYTRWMRMNQYLFSDKMKKPASPSHAGLAGIRPPSGKTRNPALFS
jgi:hypothetical protein